MSANLRRPGFLKVLHNRSICHTGDREQSFAAQTCELPLISDGTVLCRTLYILIDDAAARCCETARPGQIVPARGLLEVVASGIPGYLPGDVVTGNCGWQEYAALEADEIGHLRVCSPMTRSLSVYGRSGQLAELLVDSIGECASVVVGDAAGPIGNLVCQLLTQRTGIAVLALVRGAQQLAAIAPISLVDCIDLDSDGALGRARAWMGERDPSWLVDAQRSGASRLDTEFEGAPGAFSTVSRLPAPGNAWLEPLARVQTPERLWEMGHADRLTILDQVTTGLDRAPEVLAGVAAGTRSGEQIVKVAD